MDKRELQEIMSQGAIRPETPTERRDRKLLEEDLVGSPVKDRPLRQRLRNFRPDADSAIRALGGPTVWMRRLRAIEDELDRHEQQLDAAWHALAEELTDAAEFARAGLPSFRNEQGSRVRVVDRRTRPRLRLADGRGEHRRLVAVAAADRAAGRLRPAADARQSLERLRIDVDGD